MRFQLNKRGIILAELFEKLWGDKECYCDQIDEDSAWKVCDYCLHPGNPDNIQEDDRNLTGIPVAEIKKENK